MANNYIVTIGGAAIDEFYNVDCFPQAGDFTRARYLKTMPGGCIPNAANVMSSLGNRVFQIEYLKEDDEGTDAFINHLKNRNINIEYIKYDKDIKNCVCQIMECGNEKTIFVFDAIRKTMKIDDKTQDLLNKSTYIYTMMNLITQLFGNVDPLIKAKNNGSKIIFDAGSQYKDISEKDILYDLSSGAFLNKMAYQRLKELSNKEPYEILFENNGDFMCITDGDKGATCYTRDKIYFEKALKINVIDSTGAGDSFAGAFISSINKGYSYEKALKIASINGAYACSVIGGNNTAISEEELIKYSKENNYEL